MTLTLAELERADRARSAEAARRRRHFDEIGERLTSLRRVSDPDALLDRVCRDVVEVCGFTRSMLSRLDGELWVPWLAYAVDDTRFNEGWVTRLRGGTIKLVDAHPERDALASRRPVVVPDTSGLKTPLSGRSTSYVVVPIIPAGRVVGFLHGDHGDNGRAIDHVDRDAIWAFAEGFGRIYERAVLLARLRAQGDRVRETLELAESIAETISSAEIELVREAEEAEPDDQNGYGELEANAAFDALLTEREREVLELMVRGHGNRAIAEALVIKEGTVKSHVKHVLRKLGAANRAEAISRYLSS